LSGPADNAFSGSRGRSDGSAPAETCTPLHRALTARGATVLGGALIVGACGVLLRYPELIGLGAAGLAAVGVALAMVARAPRVTVSRVIRPAQVTRGSATGAVAQVSVRAAGRRAVPAMSARDQAGPGTHQLAVPRLKGARACELEVPLPVSRRGVVPSGPLLVAREDPFGLAHRTLDTGMAASLYVRPRAIPLPDVTASLARSVDGPQSDTSMEGTLAFNSLREYVPGDELRHVHWRASAHAGKLVVKQHVDTAHAAVAVILDTVLDPAHHTGIDLGAAGPGPGAFLRAAEVFDAAVDCAASVAVIAAKQRHPLLLLDGAGQSLLPGAGRRRGGSAVEDVLDALTLVMPTTPAAGAVDPLADSVRRLGSGPRGSLAAVVSTRPLERIAEPLRLLASAYARVLAVSACGTAGNGTTRTGRVVWVTVGSVDELPAALLRARAAA
jgi:uncharacterized protein (DUF58 family)